MADRELKIRLILEGMEEINRRLDKIEKKGEETAAKMQTGFEKLQATYLKVAAAVGSIYIAYQKVNQYVGEAIRLSSEYSSGLKALEAQTSRVNVASGDLVKRLKEVTQGEISLVDLTQTANRTIALLGTDAIPQLDQLAELALKASRVMGTTTVEAFDDLALAIGRQSRMILDNLGIIMSIETANKRYAAELGKTTKELTEAEKKQAFLNEALRIGLEKFKGIDTATKDYKNSMAELNAAWKDLLTHTGEYATKSSGLITNVNDLAGAIGLMNDRLTGTSDKLAGVYGWLTLIGAFFAGRGAGVIGWDSETYKAATGKREKTILGPASKYITPWGPIGPSTGGGGYPVGPSGGGYVSPWEPIGESKGVGYTPPAGYRVLYDWMMGSLPIIHKPPPPKTGGGTAPPNPFLNLPHTAMGRMMPSYANVSRGDWMITDYPELGGKYPNRPFDYAPGRAEIFIGPENPPPGAWGRSPLSRMTDTGGWDLSGVTPTRGKGGLMQDQQALYGAVGTAASGSYGAAIGTILGSKSILGAASMLGPYGALVGMFAGAFIDKLFAKKPHQQVTEPIPVKVVNFSDMMSSLLNITKGSLTRIASGGIDRLENLRVAQAQAGM